MPFKQYCEVKKKIAVFLSTKVNHCKNNCHKTIHKKFVFTFVNKPSYFYYSDLQISSCEYRVDVLIIIKYMYKLHSSFLKMSTVSC